VTSIALNPIVAFPPGTSVAAYPAGNWAPWQRPPSGAPLGSAAETKTVQSDGSLTYTTLTDGAEYYASAVVGGVNRYIHFFGNPTSNPNIPDLSITDADVAAANKDGAASKPSMRTNGTNPASQPPASTPPSTPPVARMRWITRRSISPGRWRTCLLPLLRTMA